MGEGAPALAAWARGARARVPQRLMQPALTILQSLRKLSPIQGNPREIQGDLYTIYIDLAPPKRPRAATCGLVLVEPI